MPMYLHSCVVIELISRVVSDWIVESKFAVSHDSNVFLLRLFALSMILEWLKSITRLKVHAYFATFEPLVQCF